MTNASAGQADFKKSDISSRVNNRSLRPDSESFARFMTEGWGPENPDVAPNESSKWIPARLEALGRHYRGERLVIPAGRPKVRNNDDDYPFRPDTVFAYYTGLGEDYEAGAVLVLDPNDPADEAAKGTHTPILFLHPRANHDTTDFYRSSAYGEYWVGARPGLDEFHVMTGLETRDISGLDECLSHNVGTGDSQVKLRVIKESDPAITAEVDRIREAAGLDDKAANDEGDNDFHETAAVARMLKDDYEIGEMRKAILATRHGFDNILRHLDESVDKPRGERMLEGAFNAVSRIEGNDVGYGTIIASGPDGPTLHWMRNTHTVRRQDMLLIDAGVETQSLYTADITRTFPVTGTFNPVQRKLYQAVFDAQQAGFEAAQPGRTYSDIHHACMRSLAESLHEWGVLKVPVKEALSPEGQQHRRWHACGVAHHLGLDVHDCAQARYEEYQGAKLTPGMIFTIEPGLYFRENDLLIPEEFRGIGIRIEDDVLMTERGPEWLSKSVIPSTIDEVEAWMKEERGKTAERR